MGKESEEEERVILQLSTGCPVVSCFILVCVNRARTKHFVCDAYDKF